MRFTPFEREQKFVDSLNIGLIQKALWPLLASFIILSFSDTATTVVAAATNGGFVELNPLGSGLFSLGLQGFMLAYLLKFVPVVPLFYMVAIRDRGPEADFQVRLLKFAAFVVLVGADCYLGAIVIGNNLPLLLHLPRM